MKDAVTEVEFIMSHAAVADYVAQERVDPVELKEEGLVK